MDIRIPNGILTVSRQFKAGDPPPAGYLEWHEWAEVQRKAGIKQVKCGKCSLWKTPQELSDQQYIVTGMTRRGKRETIHLPKCAICAASEITIG